MLSCYHVGEMLLPAVAAVAEAAAAAAPAAAVSAKIDTAMPVATDFVPTGVADTVAGKRVDDPLPVYLSVDILSFDKIDTVNMMIS